MASEVLLGDEAVALGAIHAGISGAFSYPGTPATEIFEFVEQRGQGIVHARWSPNEKVAYEEALGMSWAGKRAMVSMKHVGLNVAADAFVNSGVTGVGGGLAVVVADDPGMHSSQNEQDSRILARFALIPCLEPRNQQQCYDVMAQALELSERIGVPVLVRLVTRLAHSRSGVRLGETLHPQNPLRLPQGRDGMTQWTLLPSNARVNYRRLVEKQPALARWSEECPLNLLTLRGRQLGIISSGIATNYLEENLEADHAISTLHVGAYPLPEEKVRALVEHVEQVLVIEEGYPFIEDHLRGVFGLPGAKPLLGRHTGHVPRVGELTPDLVRAALGRAPLSSLTLPHQGLPGRPPILCQGCPHTDLLLALNEALADFPGQPVLSDIGCYTLGALPPLQAVHTCVCMGASIGMALGAAAAGAYPICSVIGDSTFGHAGLPALLAAAAADVDMTLIIVDNDYVAMTGGQPSASSGERLDRLVHGLGVAPDHCRVITPLKKHHAQNVAILKEEIAHRGLSVIISRRNCVQKKAAR